jgi:inorganic triphosphatase YgiF
MALEEPREVELKLAVAPKVLTMLETAPWLHERAAGAPRTRRLIGTYFDTSDLRLAGQRMSLRVRQVGRRRIQTLKTAADRHSLVGGRGEWEVEIAAAQPDLAAFDDDRVFALTGLTATDDLRPVFETRVRRRTLPVRWPIGDGSEAHIEMAFDRGRVVADGRSLPVCEIELELLEGPAEALLELAAALRQSAPLRLSRLDKAARGYGLAIGLPLAHEKAARLRLHHDETVEQALGHVLQRCLVHALANEAAASEGRDGEGVHQLRIALRRLRSALSIFADVLPPAARMRWRNEARWLLGALGPCRDLDVFLTDLLPPVVTAAAADPALVLLQRVAAERREAAQSVVRETLATQRAGDFFLDLACWIQRAGWRQDAEPEMRAAQQQPIGVVAALILDRRRRSLRKAGKGFAKLDPAARHAVRIGAKKLRYGMEFFAGLLPKAERNRHLAALTTLQDLLGRMNDIAVSRRLVAELVAGLHSGEQDRLALAGGGGELIGWHAHAAAAMEPETVLAWRAVKALGPCRPKEG